VYSCKSFICFLFCLGLFSTVNKDGFKPNLETHLIPLLATKSEEGSSETKEKNTESSKAVHHPLLMQVSPFVLLVIC